MSLLSNRRALVVAGITGMLLAGGALATSTAAFADAGSTDGSPSRSETTVTVADAADAAQAEYPDCEVTAALLHDSGTTPTWNIEMTCDSGTTKYLGVDAEDGSVTNNGSATDDTTSDDNDAPGTGANTDYS